MCACLSTAMQTCHFDLKMGAHHSHWLHWKGQLEGLQLMIRTKLISATNQMIFLMLSDAPASDLTKAHAQKPLLLLSALERG
jgi:hypothetical protein